VIDGQPQRAYTHLLMRLSLVLLFVWLNLTPSFALAASLNTICLNTELSLLVARVGGRVGICVSDGTNGVSLNGGEQFPLYNVVDLPVAVAVLDAVDRGQIHLNDLITIQTGDRGPASQNSAKLDGANDSKATTQDLLVRMIADSDSIAADSLIAKLGGPRVVQSVLVKKGIRGFHLDRSERDPRSFASQHHNTATPIAVANLLEWLANGWLLSQHSSALLLETMGKTRAFPGRLRAGLPTGWLIVDKSAGLTPKGVPGAANDVGILMAPDARSFVVAAVFIANSRAGDHDRATMIADIARAVGNCFQ
jgi:beta-lactamase class A